MNYSFPSPRPRQGIWTSLFWEVPYIKPQCIDRKQTTGLQSWDLIIEVAQQMISSNEWREYHKNGTAFY